MTLALTLRARDIIKISCSCGLTIESLTSDPEVIGATRDHRARCDGEVEWYLIQVDEEGESE